MGNRIGPLESIGDLSNIYSTLLGKKFSMVEAPEAPPAKPVSVPAESKQDAPPPAAVRPGLSSPEEAVQSVIAGRPPASPIPLSPDYASKQALRELVTEGTKSTGRLSSEAAYSPDASIKLVSKMLETPEADLKGIVKRYWGEGPDALLPNIDTKLKETKMEYDKAVESMGKEKAIVSMFSILGHLAMGIYGAKYGVDTSGIKFDVIDWSHRYNQITADYKMKTELLEGEYKRGEDRASKIQRLMEFARNELQQRELEKSRVYGEDVAARNRRALELAGILTKEGIAEDKAQALALRLAQKEKELEERAKILEGKQTKSAEKHVSTLAAEFEKASDKTNLLSAVAKKINPKALSYEEWKNSPESVHSWFKTDKTDYREYVGGLVENITNSLQAPSVSSTIGSDSTSLTIAGKVYTFPSKEAAEAARKKAESQGLSVK